MADDRVIGLSESDAATLRAMAEAFRASVGNTTGRPHVPPEVAEAPGVCVALAPEGGIPGLTLEEAGSGSGTGAGTGSGTGPPAAPTLAGAECAIYRIDESGELAFLEDAGDEQVVYNLGGEEVPAGSFVPVARVRGGGWVALAGGGGVGAVETFRWRYRCEAGELREYREAVTLTRGAGGWSEESGGEVFERVVACGCTTECVRRWHCLLGPAGTGSGTGSGTAEGPECLFLTDAELEGYEDGGWVHLGGPWDEELDCLGECSPGTGTGTGTGTAGTGTGTGGTGTGDPEPPPGTISTACCPGVLLPETLYVTFGDEGGCECLDGLTFPLVYDGSTFWEHIETGGDNVCGGNGIRIRLFCNTGIGKFSIAVSCPAGGSVGGTGAADEESSCDPVLFLFPSLSWSEFGDRCCEGAFSATVTEIPP